MLAELTIIPIGSGTHLADQLAEVVDIIDRSGLLYQLTPSGTCIEGDWDDVMGVIRDCHEHARRSSGHVQTVISVEDEAGVRDKLHEKVQALEKKLGHPLRREH